ncbi:hypothetical protein [Bacteroides caecimuris]|jgi:hypothetical protein|uniref:hypothetical protein n=1 Tax=Bacteroides caecimuris TaxID=1796613 RepID=UPI00080C93CA
MTRSTFKVPFYMNDSKEENGIIPIMKRMTINELWRSLVASSSSYDTADAETSQAMADILHRKKKRKRRMKL